MTQYLPKISVVTPSYNQAQFLERTIVSVINQNYPELEYMIIDGGSTDESPEIIRKYEKYLTYWVSEPDYGQSDALNKGFSKSKGDILAWLNSDDMYLPGALTKAATSFGKHPNAALIYGDYIKVDSKDRCIALRRQPSFDFQVFLYAYTIAMQPACFFQRKAFFDVGAIDPSFNYTMDSDLIMRLAQYGECIHIREYLAAFRLHKASKSMAKISLFLAERLKALEKNLGRIPLPIEMFTLRWYHTARIFFRMLKEGCLCSRLGRDTGEYSLGGIYTPKHLSFPGEG